MTVVAEKMSMNQQNSNSSQTIHQHQAGTGATAPIADAVDHIVDASLAYVNGVERGVDTLEQGIREQARDSLSFAEQQGEDLAKTETKPEPVEDQAVNTVNDGIDHAGESRDASTGTIKDAISETADATTSYVNAIQDAAGSLAEAGKDAAIDTAQTVVDAALTTAETLNAYSQKLADYTTDVAEYAYTYGKAVGQWGIDVGEWASREASEEANEADSDADRTEQNATDFTLNSKADAESLARFLVEESWDAADEITGDSPRLQEILEDGEPVKDKAQDESERAGERSSEELRTADSYSDGVEERLETDAEHLGAFIWDAVNEGYAQAEQRADAVVESAIGATDDTADQAGTAVGEEIAFARDVSDSTFETLRNPEAAGTDSAPQAPVPENADAGPPAETPARGPDGAPSVPAGPDGDLPDGGGPGGPGDDPDDADTADGNAEAGGHASVGPVGISGHADVEAGIA